jgi:hypothetical protein
MVNIVFIECPFSKNMFDIVRSRMDKVDCEINEVNIFFCITLTKHDAKIVSYK